jgi:hypothetical protein
LCFVFRYNISLAEERELALRRLQRICDSEFISVLDFWNNPLRIFAAHELAAIIDPAMTTKMTVQVRIYKINFHIIFLQSTLFCFFGRIWFDNDILTPYFWQNLFGNFFSMHINRSAKKC